MTKVYFRDIKDEIIREIKKSKQKIIICMAWFTDKEIFQELLTKMEEDVAVDITLLDIYSNKKRVKLNKSLSYDEFILDFSEFFKRGGTLTLVDRYRDYFLHNKFCVIDERVCITGSYNWSINARKNLENLLIIDDEKIAFKFIEEFNNIKELKCDKYIQFSFSECDIVDEEMSDDIVDEEICDARMFKMRVYNGSTESRALYYDLKICFNGHVEVINYGEDENDHVLSVFTRINDIDDPDFSEYQRERLLYSDIEKYLHLNCQELSNVEDQILVYAHITQGKFNLEQDELYIIFCHRVLDGYKNYIKCLESEILDAIYEY